MIVCSYEDRPGDLVGLKLLVSGLRRHAPDVPIHLWCPKPTPAFSAWIAARPGVSLDTTAATDLKGWNIKPALLLRLLAAGHDQVVWMDSDLLVTGDFRPLLGSDESLVVTPELAWNHRREALMRTRSWNLRPAARSPGLVNTALLRVISRHRQLLERWAALLRTPEYQAAQSSPIPQRPPHMIGDQDVLGALLSSEEFADLPVRLLTRGREIVHDIQGGYHPWDRLASLRRPAPPLIHAQSYKPWRFSTEPPLFDDPWLYYHFVHVETSIYLHLAREYRDQLDEDPPWLETRSLPAKVANAVALGDPHLAGLPLAVIGRLLDRQAWARHQLGRFVRAGRRLLRRARD